LLLLLLLFDTLVFDVRHTVHKTSVDKRPKKKKRRKKKKKKKKKHHHQKKGEEEL